MNQSNSLGQQNDGLKRQLTKYCHSFASQMKSKIKSLFKYIRVITLSTFPGFTIQLPRGPLALTIESMAGSRMTFSRAITASIVEGDSAAPCSNHGLRACFCSVPKKFFD
jgi:hypothetical protein